MHFFIDEIKIFFYICINLLNSPIMKNNIKISVNNKFFAFFLLLLGLNALSAINEDVIFLQTTKILIVPVFLMYFINKNNHINIACASFFIFFFLGDSASVLFTNDTFIKASSVMYFLSYMSLLIMIAPKFKFIEMNPIILGAMDIFSPLDLNVLWLIFFSIPIENISRFESNR